MSDDLGLDLFLIDSKHLLWRSASVFAKLGVDDKDGDKIDTGGIYGYLRLALAAWMRFAPTSVTIAAWDLPQGPTARRAMYSEYKRTPHHTPDMSEGETYASKAKSMRELMEPQEAKLKQILSLLGVAQATAPGWEADDVLATLCTKFRNQRIGILSGDRDLLQLVTDRITLIRPLTQGKFALETPETVMTAHGVTPVQILDLKAIAGDPGDNIPGARGIGAKGAASLIATHGSWERALDVAIASKADKGIMRKLADAEASVRISAKLAALNRAAKLDWVPKGRDGKRAFLEMSALRFNSLMADGRREHLMRMGGQE